MFLIAEDVVPIARHYAHALAGHGRVVIVPTVKQAREAFESGAWAGFVIDLGLRDGSGLVLLPAIRERYGAAPILVITANSGRWVHDTAKDHGAALMHKPAPLVKIGDFFQKAIARHCPRWAVVQKWRERFSLSAAQTLILSAAVGGANRGSIARQLAISEETLKTHMRRLLDRTCHSTFIDLRVALMQGALDLRLPGNGQ